MKKSFFVKVSYPNMVLRIQAGDPITVKIDGRIYPAKYDPDYFELSEIYTWCGMEVIKDEKI